MGPGMETKEKGEECRYDCKAGLFCGKPCHIYPSDLTPRSKASFWNRNGYCYVPGMEKTKFVCITKEEGMYDYPDKLPDFPDAPVILPYDGGRVLYSRAARDAMGHGTTYDYHWDSYQCIYDVNCPENCRYNTPQQKNCPGHQGASSAYALAEVAPTNSIDAAVVAFALIGLLTLFLTLFRVVKKGCTRKYQELPQKSDTVQEDFNSVHVEF